ncbi:hypothetical protein JAAARDRAFT_56382 [Jaapia argillacea MUCL 33604]|uniref:F-box domain-containing protein n=1 Tax=Jaapia argillacea MUCL 33604 TaxID=933084 RepID=A0A067Q0B1_9AGAM|nr:hypothetical protein JAAARDRAFT_56382 [Jaapia argillacea MUCL 33604]
MDSALLGGDGQGIFDQHPVILNSSSVNHVDELPIELLVRIFKICVIFEEKSCRPILLSRVSKCWRILVMGTPSLWTNVPTISLGRSWSFHLAMLHLRRSTPLPIDISLEDSLLPGKYGLKEVLMYIDGYMNRCQSLTIHFGLGSSVAELVQFASDPSRLHVPVLERINVTLGAGACAPSTVLSLLTDRAPLLDGMTLHSVTLRSLATTTTTFPLLSRLDLAWGPPFFGTAREELTRLFQSVPLLDTLIIRSPLLHDSEYSPPILLPHLRSLELTSSTAGRTIGFSRALSTPSLSSLIIRSEKEVDAGWKEFVDSIKASTSGGDEPRYPMLRSLELHSVGNRVLGVGFTGACPALTHLSIHGKAIDLLAMSLVPKPSTQSGINWPCLKSVEIHGTLYAGLVDLIMEKREQAGIGIERFYVHTVDGRRCISAILDTIRMKNGIEYDFLEETPVDRDGNVMGMMSM